MAFGVTATPSSLGTLNAGESIDVAFTFTGVTAETSGSAIVLFQLGAESVTVELPVNLDEPDPVVGTITTPPGLTATIVSADDAGAVISFARG